MPEPDGLQYEEEDIMTDSLSPRRDNKTPLGSRN